MIPLKVYRCNKLIGNGGNALFIHVHEYQSASQSEGRKEGREGG